MFKIKQSELPNVYDIIYSLILVWDVKFSGILTFHDNFLDLKILEGLKGFASISICFGHFNYETKKKSGIIFSIPFNVINLFTAFFFFCSGFDIMKSHLTKKDYLNNFLKRRFLKTLISFYTSNTIFLIMSIYFKNYYSEPFPLYKQFNYYNFFCSLFGIHLCCNYHWFMIDLLLLYLLFYITFKYIKNKYISIFIMQSINLYLFSFCKKNYSLYKWFERLDYHDSVYSFYFGMILAIFEKQIIYIVKKLYLLFFIYALFNLKFLYNFKIPNFYTKSIKVNYENTFKYLFYLNVMYFRFYSAILIISMKFLLNNKILNFLGKYYLEIYLYHNLIISNFMNSNIQAKNILLRYMVYTGLLIEIGFIFQTIHQIIINSLIEEKKELYETKKIKNN